MIKPGEEWGRPTTAAPDLEVAGGDADLAAAAAANPCALVQFRPDSTSDFAGAVGLGVAEPGREPVAPQGTEVTLDLLRLDDDRAAVNMLVLGTPPDSFAAIRPKIGGLRVDERTVFLGPCTAVVIAIGQFRRGLDLVPRGHPGDRRAEVQIYTVPGRERRRCGPGWRPEPTCRTPTSPSVRPTPSPSPRTDASPSRSTAERPTSPTYWTSRSSRTPTACCSDLPRSTISTGPARPRWPGPPSLPSPVPLLYAPETFSDSEAERLRPYFTNPTSPSLR